MGAVLLHTRFGRRFLKRLALLTGGFFLLALTWFAWGTSSGVPGIGTLIGGAPPPNMVPATTAQVKKWLAQAFQITGVSPAIWETGMLLLIAHESGGNPTAVNPAGVDYLTASICYSSAYPCEHAEGIAQMMPSTFATHALPGMTNIWNPVDSIASSIRYIEGKYGTVNNTPGIVSLRNGGPYTNY